MTDPAAPPEHPRARRPRLDPGERQRLLDEVARIEATSRARAVSPLPDLTAVRDVLKEQAAAEAAALADKRARMAAAMKQAMPPVTERTTAPAAPLAATLAAPLAAAPPAAPPAAPLAAAPAAAPTAPKVLPAEPLPASEPEPVATAMASDPASDPATAQGAPAPLVALLPVLQPVDAAIAQALPKLVAAPMVEADAVAATVKAPAPVAPIAGPVIVAPIPLPVVTALPPEPALHLVDPVVVPEPASVLPVAVSAPRASAPADPWLNLRQIAVNEGLLERNLIIAAARRDPAHGAFDVLRTRLLQALRDNGWKRVGITSPTKGCGKSFSALNLAIALSRYDACRTILMDMDMRLPALSRYLGVADPGSIGDMLRGITDPADHLLRFAPNRLHIGGNLALGLNNQREDYAAELFHEPGTAQILAGIADIWQPDVMLFDLPPALAQDDVIAFRGHLDCILMVVGGGITTAREVREAVRRIGEDKPVVGIILNKAEGEGVSDYSY